MSNCLSYCRTHKNNRIACWALYKSRDNRVDGLESNNFLSNCPRKDCSPLRSKAGPQPVVILHSPHSMPVRLAVVLFSEFTSL